MNSDTPSLDQSFWNSHWESGNTGWDIGYASPPITEYVSQYPHKDAAILVPGSGNAYEAAYLADHGFTDITLVDIAPKAVALQKEKFADIPQVTPVHNNFFDHQGNYDLIIEQTFFCAIPPNRREEYASKAASLLNDKSKLLVFYSAANLSEKGLHLVERLKNTPAFLNRILPLLPWSRVTIAFHRERDRNYSSISQKISKRHGA